MERWLSVIGYEGLYMVSDKGRVKSLDRHITLKYKKTQWREGRSHNKLFKGKILKNVLNSAGYYVVNLGCHGVSKLRTIHSLMAEAFIGPKPFPKSHTMHIDDVKTNNSLINLLYGSHADNSALAVINNKIPRGIYRRHTKLDERKVIEIRRMRQTGFTCKEIGEKFNVTRSAISSIVNRRSWLWVR
jgi:hypothetical protein